MAFQVSADDLRSVKALDVEQGAGQWAKVRLNNGTKAYGIPSAADPNARYLVSPYGCTCPDFTYRQRDCKHMLAVRLHCLRVQAERLERERRNEQARDNRAEVRRVRDLARSAGCPTKPAACVECGQPVEIGTLCLDCHSESKYWSGTDRDPRE